MENGGAAVQLAERDPEFRPTIARRAHAGGLDVIDRTIGDLGKALCVFWSAEHARRDLYRLGGRPEEGWGFVEMDSEKLAILMAFLGELNGARFVYVEPAPGAPHLRGLFEADEFVEALREMEGEG
jgi:hypothetical protein